MVMAAAVFERMPSPARYTEPPTEVRKPLFYKSVKLDDIQSLLPRDKVSEVIKEIIP